MDLNNEMGELLKQFKKDLKSFKDTKVKCGIIGRSGTGKSSLINAIAGEKIAKTGVTETTMEAQELIHKGLHFFDLPGCGTKTFKREDYIKDFNIKDFDCVILVTSDRFYDDDTYLIDELNKMEKHVFIVRSKIDQAVDDNKFNDDIEADETCKIIKEDLLKNLKGHRINGIYLVSSRYPNEYELDNLLDDIFSSLTLFKKERFIADVNITSEKILTEKREVAEKIVSRYSALAAANGLNPIPGADVAVDIGLLVKMSKDIQEIYGLTKEQQEYYGTFLDKKSIKFITEKILQYGAKYGGKEAIMLLLKKLSTTIATKTASKWIPFVGQIVAAGIGFKMTSSIGSDMINDAEKIARETLNSIKKM